MFCHRNTWSLIPRHRWGKWVRLPGLGNQAKICALCDKAKVEAL